MARFPRIVVPGIPHHIVQRGNRCQNVFFSDFDKGLYLDILLNNSIKFGLEIWLYCLMTNHVHMAAVPSSPTSLADGIGTTHKKYTRLINQRKGWKGYLWQGRFYSCPMDNHHLFTAAKYIENNPVRAGMVKRAEDYSWSSARAHVLHKKDALLTEFKLHRQIQDWSQFLRAEPSASAIQELKKHLRTGRPLGDDRFLEKVSRITGRSIIRGKPGPKKFD